MMALQPKVAYIVRPATMADETTLWQMLYYAAHANEEANVTIRDVQANPALALYVAGWGRTGDLGIIAEDKTSGNALGAAWLRLFQGTDKAYSATDDQTPELAIGLLPSYTGQGIGTALMQALLHAGKGRYQSIALNVRADNPALRLYLRLGFEITGELTNRVGGRSFDMVYSYQST